MYRPLAILPIHQVAIFFLAASLALAGTDCYAAIVGYTDNTNNRFTNHEDFIARAFNLSGIGKEADLTGAANESSRWVTAISRNVVISAYHGRPNGGDIHFYRDNDPNKTPVIRNVVSGERVGSTDLWIGVLDEPLPDVIKHFDFVTETLSGTPGEIETAGLFQGANAYLTSQIRRALNPETDQRIGRNRVSGYVENLDFLGQTDNDSILFEFDAAADPDFVDYETRFISEDSGGPTFIERDGQLVLLGINAFNYDDPDNGLFGSGITYVGNQADAIQTFIADNFVAAPEPSAALGLGLAFIMLQTRRRRPSSQG